MNATEKTPGPPLPSTRSGEYRLAQAGEQGFWTFHPRPLPPDPPLDMGIELEAAIDAANQALGRLDGITLLLPDPDRFIYAFVRKEAVLSSQIEGTQSSLSDLLLYENDAAPRGPVADAEETANYVAALDHGLERIARPDAPPLGRRLLREMHKLLLRSGRGSDRGPGQFRRTQNWVGGRAPWVARYVPPPGTDVEPAISELERYIHDEHEQRTLVKAALAHAQFETIHPFLDGNGRLGRLLVTLLLAAEGVLSRPLLYLSLYLKRNREAYYDHLQRVRTEGAWEEWLAFFVDGVREVSDSATDTTRRAVHLIERDRLAIHELGRAAATAHRVHDFATRFVVVRAATAAREIGLTEPPVYRAIEHLEEKGILREATGRRRGRVWVYQEYLDLLDEGTEPI